MFKLEQQSTTEWQFRYFGKQFDVSRNIMKKLSIVLVLIVTAIACYSQNGKRIVLFDGVYQTAAEIDTIDNDTTWNYLRFYKNGTVISIAASGNIDDITEWFTLSPTKNKTAWQQNPSKEHYQIKGNRISFTTTSKQGSIIYKGVVVDETKLEMYFKSLITGDEGREMYYFVKVTLK